MSFQESHTLQLCTASAVLQDPTYRVDESPGDPVFRATSIHLEPHLIHVPRLGARTWSAGRACGPWRPWTSLDFSPIPICEHLPGRVILGKSAGPGVAQELGTDGLPHRFSTRSPVGQARPAGVLKIGSKAVDMGQWNDFSAGPRFKASNRSHGHRKRRRGRSKACNSRN